MAHQTTRHWQSVAAVVASVAAITASVSALLSACGSGAPNAGGNDNLPNAGMGPMRVLKSDELGNGAPFFFDKKQDVWAPSPVAPFGTPPDNPVWLFAATRVGDGPTLILRYLLLQGRRQEGGRDLILGVTPDRPVQWESETDGYDHPAAFVLKDTVWLFYSSGGCIGRARSALGTVDEPDGKTFATEEQPVLCSSDSDWDSEPLTAPSIHVGFDKKFHLLYTSGGKIGEAIADSIDGVFTREPDPILLPADPSLFESYDAGFDGGIESPFDLVAVSDPFALTGVTSLGRPATFVYYTGLNQAGGTAIGLAGRVGDRGPLSKNQSPALTRYLARQPSVQHFDDFVLMYTAGTVSELNPQDNTSILGAIAPATASWPRVEDAGADGGDGGDAQAP